MVILVITYFTKKRKIGGEILIWNMIQRKMNFLLYYQLYVKTPEEYTKTTWPQGLSTESVTEDKVWRFLFDPAHGAKCKQGRKLKSGETSISTSNFDTKDCAILLMRSLTVTTERLLVSSAAQSFVSKLLVEIIVLSALNITPCFLLAQCAW